MLIPLFEVKLSPIYSEIINECNFNFSVGLPYTEDHVRWWRMGIYLHIVESFYYFFTNAKRITTKCPFMVETIFFVYPVT